MVLYIIHAVHEENSNPAAELSTIPSGTPTSKPYKYNAWQLPRPHSPHPATSCHNVLLCNLFLSSGYYWRYHLYDYLHLTVCVYCYMKDDKCGIAGVMCVGYLNVTRTTTNETVAHASPTHSGMAKDASLAAIAVPPAVHHGFGRPCL